MAIRTREEEEAERLLADPEPRARDVVTADNAPVLDRASRWEQLELQRLELPRFVAESLPSHLDPADWRTGFLEVHERDVPYQLLEDLRQLAPQAKLRDLHRPVTEFTVTPEVLEGTAVIGRWKQIAAELSEARAIRRPPPTIGTSLRDVLAEQRRHRALMAEPWQPTLDDDAPRREIRIWPEQSLYVGDDE